MVVSAGLRALRALARAHIVILSLWRGGQGGHERAVLGVSLQLA
jgi:hypothetical protein